jgi:hypothetical protein
MANKPRRTRTTKIKVVTETSFKSLAEQTGIPQPTISARYHRFKEMHPRKVPTVADLTTYQRSNGDATMMAKYGRS